MCGQLTWLCRWSDALQTTQFHSALSLSLSALPGGTVNSSSLALAIAIVPCSCGAFLSLGNSPPTCSVQPSAEGEWCPGGEMEQRIVKS